MIGQNDSFWLSMTNRAGRNGPVAPVLAGPVLLKVKINFCFYKMQVINKSASVIFGFVRLKL